jgi:hypothetical protein
MTELVSRRKQQKPQEIQHEHPWNEDCRISRRTHGRNLILSTHIKDMINLVNLKLIVNYGEPQETQLKMVGEYSLSPQGLCFPTALTAKYDI